MQPSQTMTTYSLVIHKKKNDNISTISTISTPNHHSQRIASTPSSIFNSNTPTILPLVGKEYMCFMKKGKSDQAVRYIKSRITTKVIGSVLSIDTFEKQCVVLKGMLQSPRLKYHVQTFGIDPSLSNTAIYEKNVLKTSKNYTNKLVSVTNINNSKIFLRLL